MNTELTQTEVLSRLSAEQKYQAAMGLLRSALRLKEASLRSWQPHLSEPEIKRLMREYLLYARS